jgi:hypothetical protein
MFNLGIHAGTVELVDVRHICGTIAANMRDKTGKVRIPLPFSNAHIILSW